jgi:phosphoribosyl 1,2-cyclic phosphate phosphodiesterase
MALEFADRVGAKQVVLTHMDNTMDYGTLSAELPSHVIVGFDGLELTI